MKIDFRFDGCMPIEQLQRNMAHCKTLGLPFPKADSDKLAIVGGAESIKDCIEEIRSFDGDRWIVAGAFRWAKDNGIDGHFFSVDPQAFIADLVCGAEKAVLASCSDPSVFEALKGDVSVFDIGWDEDRNHSGTTASAGLWAGLKSGHTEIHVFGCDSSYGVMSHAYEHHPHEHRIGVRCNGQTFVTDPLMLLQAVFFRDWFKAVPHVFKNRSKGLLEAMTLDPDYDVVSGNKAVWDLIGMAA